MHHFRGLPAGPREGEASGACEAWAEGELLPDVEPVGLFGARADSLRWGPGRGGPIAGALGGQHLGRERRAVVEHDSSHAGSVARGPRRVYGQP
jgi:hypothetical protein